MNWKFWQKQAPWPTSAPNIENISQTRNIQEKLAGIPVGCGFLIATREGMKEFKCIGIRAYPEKGT